MERVRTIVPPPQVCEQVLHAVQSFQAQSLTAHCWFVAQPRVCASDKSHGGPPFTASLATCRTRLCWAAPQVALQAPQEDQGLTRHGDPYMSPQVMLLQGFVSFKLPTHSAPPFAAECSTFRSLNVWPPPHGLSHKVHMPHSPTRQSTGVDASVSLGSQGCVSSMASVQTLPPKVGAATSARRRVRCVVPTSWQLLHADQRLKVQLTAPKWRHGASPQGSIS
mmetsp:Transcript_38125/g.104982  ORF Transcript_38125/g.104982 Transcript_38125/m.104982 type:complete len:222 (-) Transcript_38125:701-1366(-)